MRQTVMCDTPFKSEEHRDSLERQAYSTMKTQKKQLGCWICRDGKRLHIKDSYMVKDSTWAEAGLPSYNNGVFVEAHLSCLQKTLGRRLTPDDFVHCALNDWNKEVRAIRRA